MSQNDQHAETTSKISEKTEKARREFFKKVEKVIKSHGHSDKLMQDTADRAALEYTKVFGRIGVHPLLHLKGGKKAPRYIKDRDEVWVMHKPTLWQMGGHQQSWKNNVERIVRSSSSLTVALDEYLEQEGVGNIYEWHGLSQGLLWMDKDLPVTGWGFIQRLDVETDGPIVAAKTWRAQRCLQVQMREHLFAKGYLCLVHGRLENKVQYISAKFAELGSDAATQVMLKYDNENDPFFTWSYSGKWKGRNTKRAETFLKPIAYYTRKEDNTEYSLVYVNILTGITHQVRVTLQSLGHPLVSDDRYLPKDQALADLKWCPRNFLCEVRSEFFDLCGPYRDEARRRYTRISTENPLPRYLQGILENKLTLVEQLDPTADLFIGCQYWALGDEQLLNAYPKDTAFRRKVMRWGQRKGIHLDALDRLLLLPKEDIDKLLTDYRSPEDKLDLAWECPETMEYFNLADGRGNTFEDRKVVPGKPVVEEDIQMPRGWMHYLGDPTFHFLLLVQPKYLEARRKVLKFARPSWEKPPAEKEGSPFTEEILKTLDAALVLNAKSGEMGIQEEDLLSIPGLENLTLPLAAPPEDSNIQRVRLTGRGHGSQWTYTLKGKERIKHTAEFCVKTKRLTAPLAVKADKLPAKMVVSKADKERQEKRAAQAKKAAEAMKPSLNSPEREDAEEKGRWTKKESKSNPGKFYYVNSETGETSVDEPPGFEEVKEEPAVWSRIESKSNRGQFYYFNSETGETSVELPAGAKIKTETSKVKVEVKQEEDDDGIAWERRESKTKPGNFYYFNPKTGSNEIHPPRVELPWKLLESKSKKGQFYYFNEDTGENDVNPPSCARAATKPGEAPEKGTKRPRADEEEGRRTAAKAEKLPPGWTKKESDKYKGKFYYVNGKTGETSWTRPSEWERQESKSNPGTFYYVNSITGETSWDKKVVNGK